MFKRSSNMSVALEGISTPIDANTNLQTTIETDLQPSKEAESQEENTKQSEDIVATFSPRAKLRTYTKDEFMKIKEVWLSNIRPAALLEEYYTRDGIWEPELWFYSAESEKRSASPIQDAKKKYLLDGIVLSPQGRSFARGCQVNVDKQDGGGRNEGRGKMSGRLGRGWDGREKGRGKGRNSPNADTRFERNFKNADRNDGKSRRRAGSLESQPEWYTYGPSSQLETIELKGFDDADKGNKRRKRRKDADEAAEKPRQKTPDKESDESQKFDINSFFDMAENALPIPGMYENQGTSSRFSQWFANGSRSRSNSLNASLGNNSRRSSIADELAEIAGLTLSSPVRTPSPDSEFMFAPIVPASDSREDDFLNIIQPSDVDVQPLLDSVIPHKTVKGAVTLEDLEGEDVVAGDAGDKKAHEAKTKEESQVFLKLVQTMKESGNLPEKPAPTIPDIPPHLLPRPPSAKDKNRSRSPSPLQLLQEVIRRSQSPVGFPAQPEPRLIPSYDALREASPVADILSPITRSRPLTPEEIFGAPPVFKMDTSGSDLFEFTGSVANIDKQVAARKKLPQARHPSAVSSSQNSSGQKPSPVISQAFVPTAVLRKFHCNKHDQKSSDGNETKKATESPTLQTSQRTSFTRPRDSTQASSTLMSPREFTSPKTTQDSRENTLPRPEPVTPHRLPLPRSPSMTPHSLPLPYSPQFQDTSKAPSGNPPKPLLTPHSLPLPQSPLVSGANSNPPSDFGIRPLPKSSGVSGNDRSRPRGSQFRKPFDQRQNNNMRRFPQGQFPYRGQMPVTPNMIPRPGMIPSPFNMNAARAMNVHPTALALALRNQQYQMVRAAAVAAATAAVNHPAALSQAHAAAAAMMLNQQRAQTGFRGIMPQMNQHMFPQHAPRPSLPPALQRQHHVVHHSESNKDNSLSKWFSDAVLSQSQSQPTAPGRGAKVLSVEELERHACV